MNRKISFYLLFYVIFTKKYETHSVKNTTNNKTERKYDKYLFKEKCIYTNTRS